MWSAHFELAGLDAQHRRGHLEQDVLGLFGGETGGVAGHVGGAAGNRAGVHRRRVGIRRHHVDVVGGDAELLRDDLGQDGQRALPGFNRAGEQRGGAVFVDLDDRRARVRRDGEPDRIPHACDAASPPFHDYCLLPLPLPFFHPKRSAACSSDSFTTTLCSFWLVGLSDPSSSAFISRISSGSMSQILRHVVHVRLVGEADLRGAEPAHGSRHRLVGVDDEGFGVEVVDLVGTGGEDARLAERGFAPRTVGAALEDEANLTAQDLAFLRDARLVVHDQRVPRRRRHELLWTRERALDRTAGLLRQQRHHRLGGDLVLAAEVAADDRRDDADAAHRHANRPGDIGAAQGDTAEGGINRHAAVGVPGCKRGVRLERHVLDHLGAELPFVTLYDSANAWATSPFLITLWP